LVSVKTMTTKALYLSGKFEGTDTHIEIFNPFNKESIALVSVANGNHIEQAILKAKEAQEHYKQYGASDISKALFQIAEKIDERQQEFMLSIISESAKPHKYALAEVNRAIETFRMAGIESTKLPHELLDLSATATGQGLMGRVQYISSGIVAGISPFNFPLNLVAHKIAPAIATKSPIILKPSSKTPLTALLLAEVIHEIGLPDGALSVLPCSRQVGDLLVSDPRISVLSFTGSPEIGWDMKNRAGKKKVVLELGGNAAAIVHNDADLDEAVNQLVVGAFAYSGQVCIHTQRIFVQKSIFKTFIEKFIAQTQRMNHGNPENAETDFSCMIDEANAIRIDQWLKEARNAGAEIVFGGTRKGSYFDPTIVQSARKGMKIYDEEVFGPVVCLAPYSELDEAIDLVNDSRFGLQAAVFTKQHTAVEQCFAKLEVGGVILNRATTFRTDQMPYGGIKDSGFGREGIKYAMMHYLEPKLLVF